MRRLGFCTASTFVMLALISVGCSSGSSSSLVAEPGFAMPAAGDATKTVRHLGDKFPVLSSTDLDGNPVTFDQLGIHAWPKLFLLDS